MTADEQEPRKGHRSPKSSGSGEGAAEESKEGAADGRGSSDGSQELPGRTKGRGVDDQSPVMTAIVKLLHPIPLTVMVILVGVTLLIAAAVLGWDSGNVLSNMSTSSFARGLITYLFAVTTIGTSVVLVLAALLKDIDEESFQHGKEVLGLLLGVFGTIVGFYFGSEAGAVGTPPRLALSEIYVSEASVAGGDTLAVVSAVSGGRPPFRFAVGRGPADALEFRETVRPDGLITGTFVAPQVDSGSAIIVLLAVRDARNEVVVRETSVRVEPSAETSP